MVCDVQNLALIPGNEIKTLHSPRYIVQIAISSQTVQKAHDALPRAWLSYTSKREIAS
jgi:hypothetical protein